MERFPTLHWHLNQRNPQTAVVDPRGVSIALSAQRNTHNIYFYWSVNSVLGQLSVRRESLVFLGCRRRATDVLVNEWMRWCEIRQRARPGSLNCGDPVSFPGCAPYSGLGRLIVLAVIYAGTGNSRSGAAQHTWQHHLFKNCFKTVSDRFLYVCKSARRTVA